MNLQSRLAALLLLLSLAITAGLAGAQDGTLDEAGLRFTGSMPLSWVEELFGVDVGGVPTLSPDGTRLAWIAADGLCTLSFDDGSNTCYGEEDLPMRIGSALYWSPDSMAIAFHEDAVYRQNESDIWLLELK